MIINENHNKTEEITILVQTNLNELENNNSVHNKKEQIVKTEPKQSECECICSVF
jgi:hypothetical protein